jgi:hypothetical protein
MRVALRTAGAPQSGGGVRRVSAGTSSTERCGLRNGCVTAMQRLCNGCVTAA